MRDHQSYGSNAKRMRLGTKSCAECRRRKIRCIIQPGQQVCDSCALHETVCQSQKPPGKNLPIAGGDDEAIKTRLVELESMVGSLQAQLRLTQNPANNLASIANPGSSAITTSANPSMPLLRPSRDPTSSSAGYPASLEAPDQVDGHTGAPLMDLLIDAKLMQIPDRFKQESSTVISTKDRAQDAIRSLGDMLPDTMTLQVVLAESSPFWCTWPPCYYAMTSSDILQPAQQTEALNFLYTSFKSQLPATVAKAVLFLSLCIQQLPKTSAARVLLPQGLSLIDNYVELCSTLLLVGNRSSHEVDDLEARMFLYKLCINIGKPQLAWSTIRAAVESAMLQGLHRPHKGVDLRRRLLWDMIWQSDRQSASILGMPSSIFNSHVAVSSGPAGDTLMEDISYRIFRLVGDVIDRDQNPASSQNYAATIQLDQDCAAIRPLIPSTWDDPAVQADMSLGTLYDTQCLKMKYLILKKQIHFPWMLKSISEPRYQHSRTTTFDAIREFIASYINLRANKKSEHVNCEIMDFEAFSSAIILIIGLLSESGALNSKASQMTDWELVDKCTQCLAETAAKLECSIASQAVHVLQILTGKCQGDANNAGIFETAIPFFGHARINYATPPNQHLQATAASNNSAFSENMAREIEFSASIFGQNIPMDFGFGAELGADWTSFVDFDAPFDWSQTFSQGDASREMDGFTTV
ncbi:hypothetical protein AK830_g9044 [Neonectria ditissima]|uniref:Zn(2)-C6 fungal-type domain-containing protein n=1 Tax=Neonectria ditissima TaxID=78410 RepID=A0A0P7BD06_9HYPO|nr:hypothetical protein AK830_g9044 [Neonectria ditissima]